MEVIRGKYGWKDSAGQEKGKRSRFCPLARVIWWHRRVVQHPEPEPDQAIQIAREGFITPRSV